MATSTAITDLINAFTTQIAGVVEAAATDRVRAVVAGVLGTQTRRPPGRPRKTTSQPALAAPASRKRASARVARARRLQGRYLGLLKGLKGDDRSRLKAVASEQGVAAALKFARALKR
jgi:hypothetical protein